MEAERSLVWEVQNRIVHVVDDDAPLRDTLVRFLQFEGFDVFAHASAAAFLRDAAPDEACCLVIDVNMHGMTGVELLERLRGDGHTTPAILMTGMPDARIREAAARLGALFLGKPFLPDTLVERIAEARR